MLDHRDIEEIVATSLDPASGLVVSTSADLYHYLTLAIHPNPLIHERFRPVCGEAQIKTNGVDTFVLDLDDRYEYRDIDREPQGQRQILILMTRLAEAYLGGGGREGESRGLSGRSYGHLSLELEGESFLFEEKGG